MSSGTLAPVFVTATKSYVDTVANSISLITFTPTAADATATITINGAATTSGSASAAIALSTGNNTITIVVTAQDGVTKQTYTIVVNRAAPVQTTVIANNFMSPNGDGKNDTWVVTNLLLIPTIPSQFLTAPGELFTLRRVTPTIGVVHSRDCRSTKTRTIMPSTSVGPKPRQRLHHHCQG